MADRWQIERAPSDHHTEIAAMTEVAVNRELILEAMARLTPAQRDVICRSYYEARTTAQIADELHIDEATVKSRLHFGVRALLRSLEEIGSMGTRFTG